MEETVIQILVEICETEEIRDHLDIDLFEAGLIDSLTYVDLLIRLENTFHISLPPSEVDKQDISSVEKIVALLHHKSKLSSM